MQERIKVSDFYKQLIPIPAIELSNIIQAFLTPQNLFAVTVKATHIHKYSLQNPENCSLVPLPHPSTAKLTTLQSLLQIGDLICYCLQREENIWYYNGIILSKIQAHFAPITALANFSKELYSSSEDLTIRVWNIQDYNLVPNAPKHALTGHTGKINCLLTINSLLLSGSQDKTVAAWQSNQQIVRRQFSSSIKKLFYCQTSNLLCVLEKIGTISIVDNQALVRNKNLIVSRVIQGLTLPFHSNISQIDDSFILVTGEQSIEVAETNLGTVVAHMEKGLAGRLLAVRAIRRLILMVVENRGLFIVKL